MGGLMRYKSLIIALTVLLLAPVIPIHEIVEPVKDKQVEEKPAEESVIHGEKEKEIEKDTEIIKPIKTVNDTYWDRCSTI